MKIFYSLIAAVMGLWFGIGYTVRFVFQWYLHTNYPRVNVEASLALGAAISFIISAIALVVLIYSVISWLKRSDAKKAKKFLEEEKQKRKEQLKTVGDS